MHRLAMKHLLPRRDKDHLERRLLPPGIVTLDVGDRGSRLPQCLVERCQFCVQSVARRASKLKKKTWHRKAIPEEESRVSVD